MDLTRRRFVKMAGIAAVSAGFFGLAGLTSGCGEAKSSAVNKSADVAEKIVGEKSKVYFTKNIDVNHLIQLYDKVSENISGKVAIKLHSGEPHGPNIIPPSMVQPFQAHIPNSTIIEANTAYGSARRSTAAHRKTLQTNGWDFSTVDIIDEDGDVDFPVNGGLHLKKVAVGSHLANYDSLVVLTHFKGHAMGGYGGSLKNIAIGCASGAQGKLEVHGVKDYGKWVLGELFMELMADSGKAICDHFGNKITFVNVLRRMSVDCDCAGTSAAEPTMADIGILASTDILAIDQASIDLVYSAPDSKDLRERIESREGLRQLSAMDELKMGNRSYELITL
ncbi:MAG: DUF362 domain-containing protein [Selenomonadaceae bacterium]|nr:DUF362 domain-containing protein [Selenomonadaceae bacterium]